MNPVLSYLEINGIQYTLHEHQAAFTCEEIEAYAGHIPGLSCKNLLLRNRKKTRYFLFVLPADKKTNMKIVRKIVQEESVSFASAEAVKEKLNLEPGSVSPFGLINDENQVVEFFLDREVYEAEVVNFHPNINTATLEMTQAMFHKYLDGMAHEVSIVTI